MEVRELGAGRSTRLTVCTNTCRNVHTHVHTCFLPKLVLLLAIVQAQRLSINQTCCKALCNAGSFSVKFDEHWRYYFRREVAVVTSYKPLLCGNANES